MLRHRNHRAEGRNTMSEDREKRPLWKNPRVIHGAVLTAMAVACFINYWRIWFCSNWLLWFCAVGYGMYWMGHLAGRCARDEKTPRRKVLSRIILTIAFIPGALFISLPAFWFCSLYFYAHPEYAKDLPTYQTRGMTLRNAAYYLDGVNQLFEGDIEEEDLKKGAFPPDHDFAEITERRHVGCWDSAVSMIEYRENGTEKEITVEEGLIYDNHDGTDHGIRAVWDRKTKRLYFHYNTR